MTVAPTFRVFLENSKENIGLRSLFPDGLPCKRYYAQDPQNLVPKDFVFELDYSSCNEFQIKKIFKGLGEEHEHKQLDLEHHPFLIEFEDIVKVVDWENEVADILLLQQCWLLTNHAKKIEAVSINIDGNSAHLLIMGLQQALHIDNSHRSDVSRDLLTLAVQLINGMAMNNDALKEAYLEGFPLKYIAKARKLLFP